MIREKRPPNRPPAVARVAILVVVLALAGAASPSAAAERYRQVVAGREALYVVPDDAPGAAPVIAALHGCGQTPEAFLALTGLETLVDREGVALALPRAAAGGANPLGCWRWWDPQNQRRDGDDPRHVMAVIEALRIPVDQQRIYTLGLSSGGAMSAILATLFPERIAAAAIHSGVGFALAGNTACAVKALGDAPERSLARGELAYLHQRSHRVVPTLVLQGRADDVVDPRHARGLVEEIAQRNDFIDDGDGGNDSFDDIADTTLDSPGPCRDGAAGGCYPHRLEQYRDAHGEIMLTRVLVERLGHDWSGGTPGYEYSDPSGPDATAMLWDFFRERRLDPAAIRPAAVHRCREWRAAPWWHYLWGGSMSFGEYACDMNPWKVVWRHRIDGVAGPGRCP